MLRLFRKMVDSFRRRSSRKVEAAFSFMVAVLVSAGASAADSCLIKIGEIRKPPIEAYPGMELSVEARIGYRTLFQTPRRPIDLPRWVNGVTASTAKSHPLVFVVRVWRPDGNAADIPVRTDADKVERVEKGPECREQVRIVPSVLESDVSADEVLSTGFEGYVGDFSDNPEQKPRQGREGAGKVTIRCSTSDGVRSDRPGRDRNSGAGSVVKSNPAVSASHFGVLCETSLAWPPADGEHVLRCAGSELVIRTLMLKGNPGSR